MKLVTNKISVGKSACFDDFIKKFKEEKQKKTASATEAVKVAAEQEEAESSGQLDVEPLHQTGESTTMPKNGPSAKKDDGEKSAAATKGPDAEGPDSGQPKAEGTEKFTNDPEVPSKEEKGGSTEETVKVAATCEKCKKSCDECECEKCDCKPCTAAREAQIKEAGIKGNCEKCGKPNFICKGKCDGTGEGKGKGKMDGSCKDDKDDKKEEKDASKDVKFVKIANLDAKNKTFLKEYWRQLYGDDYANALVADK